MRPRISIRGSVRPSVRRSVRPLVGPSVGPSRHYSASGFCITAPAQSHVTDALVYMAPPTAPAPHITAPAQPHATDAVATALFFIQVVSRQLITLKIDIIPKRINII